MSIVCGTDIMGVVGFLAIDPRMYSCKAHPLWKTSLTHSSVPTNTRKLFRLEALSLHYQKVMGGAQPTQAIKSNIYLIRIANMHAFVLGAVPHWSGISLFVYLLPRDYFFFQ